MPAHPNPEGSSAQPWHKVAAKEIQTWAQSGALHCPDDELVSAQAKIIAKHDPCATLTARLAECERALAIHRKAMVAGWTVNKASLYDEEGVDGWTWHGPNNEEYSEIGSWDELPEMPERVIKALNPAASAEKI